MELITRVLSELELFISTTITELVIVDMPFVVSLKQAVVIHAMSFK
jgi:hypothetical protein